MPALVKVKRGRDKDRVSLLLNPDLVAITSRGGRLTEKGQPIDRFLSFNKQTEKKTEQLSVNLKLAKKTDWTK